MTANLLDYGDYNVIAVNWGGGSLPLYTQATANTRLVGLEIAHLVNTLVVSSNGKRVNQSFKIVMFIIFAAQDKFGVDPGQVQLIGHSLGSHIMGYAGERIANLGRITGLDPAEPYFQWLPAHIRLDPTDAKFVEAIHTDTRTILLLGFVHSRASW